MDSLDSVLQALYAQSAQRRTLENGLTVIVREDASCQVSSVQLWIKTGSVHEGPLLGSGVSHYLEHMLFKGTEKRSGKEISREVQGMGGYINAYTSFDRTVYYIDVPSEHTMGAMEILADAGFNSTLPADEVEKEKDVILREIDMGLDDPDQRLSRALFETAFKTHPYRYPVIGYKDLFKSISREELSNYYHTRYVPNNAVLIVVGDVDAEEIFAGTETLLGAFERKRLAPLYIPEEALSLAKREQVLTGDVNITRVGLGFAIPGLRHEDSPGLSLLASVLGNGDSSILFHRLRQELGLVHEVDVSCWNPGSSGLLWISLITDFDKKDAAVHALWDEINRLKHDLIGEALLLKAQRQAMVGEINSRKTMSGQAGRLGAAEVVVGDLEYPRIFLSKLQQVRVDDLRRLLNHYIVEDRLTQVSLLPEDVSSSKTQLEKQERESHLFSETRLPNGARLLFQNGKTFPKIHMRVIFKGGALHEKPDQRGLSALAANLLTKDTAKRTAAEVASAIESAGGGFTEFSGNNTFGLAMEVVPSDLDLALDLLEQSLLHLKIDPATFDLGRDGQIAHIKESMDDVVDFGIRELRRKFFGDFPYSVGADGRIRDLENLAPADAESHLASLIRSDNCVIAVSGLLEDTTLEGRLTSLVNQLPGGYVDVPDAGVLKPAATGREEVELDREQAVVFQAFPGVGVMQDELMVISAVLDELFSGMSSRLFERVRDDLGLAYFVGGSRVIGMVSGMFFLYGGTHPSTAEKVLDEMASEVNRIQSGGIEAEELQRIKTRLWAQRRMNMQAIGSRAMQAGLNATYGLPVNDWIHFDEKLARITVEDLAAFARQYFAEDKRLELIVRAVN